MPYGSCKRKLLKDTVLYARFNTILHVNFSFHKTGTVHSIYGIDSFSFIYFLLLYPVDLGNEDLKLTTHMKRNIQVLYILEYWL